MDLDARDRRLLCLLDRNARRPLSHLSKDLQISKQAATQRVLKLRRSGIISSPYALLNTLAMARVWGRLLIRLRMATPKIEKEMADFAKKQKGMDRIAFLSGAYDVALDYWSESVGTFKKAKDEFLSEFADCIKENEISFVTAKHSFSVRAFAPEVESVESVITEGERLRLDGNDRKILGALSGHADWSALQIGKRAGIDAKTVYYRVKRLEEDGAVLNYRIRIDYAKLGYAKYRFFIVFGKHGEKKKAELLGFLKSLPEILSISETLGNEYLEFEAAVPSVARVHEIIADLRGGFSGLVEGYGYAEVRAENASGRLPE